MLQETNWFSSSFRDLINQILHFPPDQRKQQLENALRGSLVLRRQISAPRDFPISLRAAGRFYHSWPTCSDATSSPWPGCRGNPAFPQAGRALCGRQAHAIHSLSARSPIAWLSSEPECRTARLSAREAISSCLPKDSSISHKPQNGSQKKGKKQLLRQNK